MADKTTTLKTKTNDNVYPNVIGDNRKNAFVDSSTITHHFYDQTHKVGFQIANETNIKIQNSLQKPTGLTKTKLVGVGTNGQENIEIGDNLTLSNGKLSATGGGSSGDNVVTIKFNDSSEEKKSKYVDAVTNQKPLFFLSYLRSPIQNYDDGSNLSYVMVDAEHAELMYVALTPQIDETTEEVTFNVNTKHLNYMDRLQYHFITMTNSANNVALYFTIFDINETAYTSDTLIEYLIGKKFLVNGNLHGAVPTYITAEGIIGKDNVIKVYYMTPGSSDINPQPDEFADLSSFTITDEVISL